MADETKKASVPAWQQSAAQSDQNDKSSTSSPNATSASSETDSKTQSDTTTTASTETKSAAATSPDPPPSTSGEGAEADQRDQIRQFLKDPAVEGQSADKKRTFLQTKGMPASLIEEELAASQQLDSLQQSDFDSFRQQQDVASKPPTDNVQPSTAAPPIITYPEFLAEAHRPDPLITPGRILTTTYIASVAAALLYGASTLLVKPMSAVLTDARHEFALHSKSKVDEMNAKLEKLVSQVPGARSIADNSDSDADSLASDPTELYHRDIGTQTDSAVQTSKAAQVAFVNNDSADTQAEKMRGLEKDLETLLKGIQKQGDATREREESVSKLRHYLDSMAYNGGVNVWNNNGIGYGWEPSSNATQKSQEKKSDSIEDLKKEIRGVKGVLLSAKRFPAAAQNGPSNRYRSSPHAPA